MAQQQVKRSQPQLSVLNWIGVSSSSAFMFVVSLGAVLFAGLSVVEATHDNRFSFNELQELREAAIKLDVEWGQLLLEQSTFGVEGKIEAKAVEQLQMKVPEISKIVMVTDE